MCDLDVVLAEGDGGSIENHGGDAEQVDNDLCYVGMILTSKIEFKSRNELDKTDRQRNKAKIGFTLEKKKDSGFRKEEGRE